MSKLEQMFTFYQLMQAALPWFLALAAVLFAGLCVQAVRLTMRVSALEHRYEDESDIDRD